MDNTILREWWVNSSDPIFCKMLDGAVALLILGPRNADVEAGRGKFGFQVPGEEEIRFLYSEQLEKIGDALVEISLPLNGR